MVSYIGVLIERVLPYVLAIALLSALCLFVLLGVQGCAGVEGAVRWCKSGKCLTVTIDGKKVHVAVIPEGERHVDE